MRAREVFDGSDGDLTKRYYAELEQRGAIGFVAMNLFRAQKCSARAKLYRGGGFKGAAYERKNWSMGLLAHALAENGASLGIPFGWKKDPNQPFHNQVLYVDLPTGQCSFHAASRGEGPDYAGDWDGQHLSAERILAFCDMVSGLAPQHKRQRNRMPKQPALFPAPRAARKPKTVTSQVSTHEKTNAECADVFSRTRRSTAA